ncbi:hypothetical protein ROS1_56570 [Roseibium sp. ROS1]
MVCFLFPDLAGVARFIFRVVGNGGGGSRTVCGEGITRAHKARAAERGDTPREAAQRFILDLPGGGAPPQDQPGPSGLVRLDSANLEISMVERIGWQLSPPANALPVRLLLSIP